MKKKYADIEDSGIVTAHDKEINEEYECNEFYINGFCYKNTKIIFETIDIDSDFAPYCFGVKLNKNGHYVCNQSFCHYGKIIEPKNGIIRFDMRINYNMGRIGKIVLYKNGDKWIGTYEY